MRISLVIPVHNLEKYIEPLLVSLKYQVYDHSDIEPIFICDCCEDRTHQIIEDYLCDSFPYLIVEDRNYKSSGLARNDGIEIATGDLIWLLDGDDWLTDNHAIAKVVSYFNGDPKAKILHTSWTTNTYPIRNYNFTVWQWIVCAEWAKNTKFTSRPYDDDVEWVRNLMTKYDFNGCASIQDPLYFYNYMREGSVMSERIKNKK